MKRNRKNVPGGVPCDRCSRTFGGQRARDQHREDAHGLASGVPVMSKEGARAVMDEMDDLPDGAFFAMAQELGLGPEDFAD